MRARAGELFREESARQAVSRLWNSAPRPLIDYQVGDFVMIWRTMTLKARKRDENYNPEARFFWTRTNSIDRAYNFGRQAEGYHLGSLWNKTV